MKTLTGDLICAGLAFCWLAALAAVTFSGEGGDNAAAWVQAVGSVLAILAAIWIDQGAARRAERAIEAARQDRLTIISEAVGEWRTAFFDSVRSLQNLSNLAPLVVHPDTIDEHRADWLAIVANQRRRLDVYLTTPPPNPSLAWAAVAVQTELMAVEDALERFDRNRGATIEVVARTIQRAAQRSRQIEAEYRGEVA